MMINYETIVDCVSAIIVILGVATIIAAAWISTNVREQPLIATAVVVFQRQSDGENTEQNSNEEGTGQNPTNNNNSNNSGSRTGTADTNVASASAAPSVEPLLAPSVRPKEPRSQIKGAGTMEENSRKEEERDVMEIERSTEGKEEDKLENKKEEFNIGFEKIGDDEINKEDVICSEENSSANEEFSPIQNESLINKTNEISPEMEIRNRRLKHFISMGNDDNLENKSETIVENNIFEESSFKKDTNSKENSDTSSTIKIDPGVESCVSESSAEKIAAEVLEKKEEIEPPPPGSIRIRLKFLDDTLRFVHALPTDLIGHFKRQQFSLEISENRHIRLIFNGQLLSSDSSTLSHYGLFDNCVVHCHVSAPQQPAPENSSNNMADLQHDDDDTFMSGLLAPLLYCVLMVMWYLRYQYGHLFNTCSSVILLCLTALLLISTYLLYTTQQQQQQPTAPTSSSNHNSSTRHTNAVGQITLGAS